MVMTVGRVREVRTAKANTAAATPDPKGSMDQDEPSVNCSKLLSVTEAVLPLARIKEMPI